MEPRTKLLDLLAEYAYQYRPTDPFLLASGERSSEYLDCKLALSHPEAMSVLGAVVWSLLERDVEALGGLTMGADPIAMSTCQFSAATDRQVRWFCVRKDPKVHGQRKLIEGAVGGGTRVAVVDDVVTSGSSTIKAIEACRRAELDVAQVIVLVDREQAGGLAAIEAVAGSVPVSAVFKMSEIKQRRHTPRGRSQRR